jgi:pilus assembly protein CpaB
VVASGSVGAGARVDVVATTDKRTRVLMQDVEVLAATPAAAGKEGSGPRVQATLRVSARDAIFLVAAQSFAQDVRLLARAPGDTRETEALVVGDGL